jgi:hypothetical protein
MAVKRGGAVELNTGSQTDGTYWTYTTYGTAGKVFGGARLPNDRLLIAGR